MVDPATPVKLAIVGGVGTGKSTVLAGIRDQFRAAARPIRTRVPQLGDQSDAVVIDDAHLLTDTELTVLTELAGDPAATVIVAAEPRTGRPALSALLTAIERENPRLALGPWSRTELARQLGSADPVVLDTVLADTAGLPFLVHAGAAGAALTDRLRRFDEDLLATLLIMSLDAGLGVSDVAAALHAAPAEAQELVDRAYATGLLTPPFGSRFRTGLHQSVATLTGAARHHEIESEVLRTQIEMSTLSTDLALTLAEHGLRDHRVSAILEERAAGRGPAEAARLLTAAVDAGADSPASRIRLADALALTGDCPGAAAVADQLLGTGDPAERPAAVRIAASMATHDGNTGQAAELFDWLTTVEGPPSDAAVSAAGTMVLVAAGQGGPARALVAGPSAGPPTLAARSTRSLAEGLLLSLDQPYPVAAARLGQALGAPAMATRAMPDSAPALCTLVALHAGDAIRARNVIGRAVAETAADALFVRRHCLLRAWTKMLDGQLGSAAADTGAIGDGLRRRDALWLAGLRTGIARRSDDSGALQQHWFTGLDILAEYSVDLFCLLPLGELWVAGARLRRADQLSYALDQAFGLLADLGDPPAWSLPLHWAGVHAAILANAPASMARHGQALAAAADSNPFAAALAAAGRAWLRVLARQVDLDEVARAARGLAQFGLAWDATRLASQAALHAADPRVSAAMLQVARDLKMVTDTGESGAQDPSPAPHPAAPSRPQRSPLSDREREVAELLLLGMPYRDIGAQLFISAKTVEHHVARIRRRLGAESRSEMLSMLRAMLAPQA